MRFLIIGAGNIGSLYAAKLAQSAQEVTVLARGARLEEIRQRGRFGHAEHGRAEWVLLADEVRQLIEQAGIPTPSLDAAYVQLSPT